MCYARANPLRPVSERSVAALDSAPVYSTGTSMVRLHSPLSVNADLLCCRHFPKFWHGSRGVCLMVFLPSSHGAPWPDCKRTCAVVFKHAPR